MYFVCSHPSSIKASKDSAKTGEGVGSDADNGVKDLADICKLVFLVIMSQNASK